MIIRWNVNDVLRGLGPSLDFCDHIPCCLRAHDRHTKRQTEQSSRVDRSRPCAKRYYSVVYNLSSFRLLTTTASHNYEWSCPPNHLQDGPSTPVAADSAPAAAGRGLWQWAVSEERFQTGDRKRLPGERRTVGQVTEKSVSAGRVPSGPGRRLRPVHAWKVSTRNYVRFKNNGTNKY